MKFASLFELHSVTKDESATGSRGKEGENRLKEFCISDEAISGSLLLRAFTWGGSFSFKKLQEAAQ